MNQSEEPNFTRYAFVSFVDEEVRQFCELGRVKQIIPVITKECSWSKE